VNPRGTRDEPGERDPGETAKSQLTLTVSVYPYLPVRGSFLTHSPTSFAEERGMALSTLIVWLGSQGCRRMHLQAHLKAKCRWSFESAI